MNYERDIFYDCDKLTLSKRKKFINEAYKICNEWRVDKLDCSVSWARQQVEMSFEEIMSKFDTKCHFVVIYRKGFILDEYTGEVVFTTMHGMSYYLWVFVGVDKFMELVNKYKLEVKN